MPLPDLTDEDIEVLIAYARRKYDGERWPLSVELRSIKDVLDKLKPARAPAEPPRIYAPPRATAKQRRGDPRR